MKSDDRFYTTLVASVGKEGTSKLNFDFLI